MPRVHEVAREFGLTSKEVMAELEGLGHPVSSHASAVDEATVAELRKVLGDGVGPAVLEPADAAPSPPPKHRRGLLAHLAEIPLLVGLAFAIAILIKTFLVQAFYIPSGSMLPTLQIGDRVLVEKVSYRFGGPSRGDVVVFAREVFGSPPDLPWHQDLRNSIRELLGLPVGTEEDYIKRVVAVGGDTIRYAGSPRVLYINGEAVAQPFIKDGEDPSSPALTGDDCERLEMERRGEACVVPVGMVFVMGDNRGNSEDSRIIGPISEDKIVGHAFVIIWPPGDFGGL